MKVWVISLLSVFASFSIANELGQVNLSTVQQAFLRENQKITKTFAERYDWEGWFCDGYYQYDLEMGAEPTDIRMDLADDNSITVRMELKNLYATLAGVYRSKATACLPVGVDLGIRSDWAKLHAIMTLEKIAKGKSKINVKVVSTEMGRLHFGRFVPREFEDFVTGLTNRSLSYIWSSKVGGWLNHKISEIIEKQRKTHP